MADIKIINVSSYEDATTKLPEIAAAFEENGVLVVRGHEFSLEEHTNLVKPLGDIYGWSISSSAGDSVLESAVYPGGHSDNPEMNTEHTKDDYLLDWHIEQVYYIYPILAGAWNMTKFTAEDGAGTTRFIDSAALYNDLSNEEQEFLSKSVVVWDKPFNLGTGPFYTKAVDSHPYGGYPVIRVETDRGCYVHPHLHLWEKQPPSDKQKKTFESIMEKIKSRLNDDKEIRITQQWEQGDLLIVDLFRMYHAVMGGFKYNERIFTGIGVRPEKHDNSLYTDVELLWTN
jgi:alpha-ketoglutarate-dependent taurine dioxygenase